MKSASLCLAIILLYGACTSKATPETTKYQRSLDTAVRCGLFEAVMIPQLVISGNSFSLSGNLSVFQQESGLIMYALDSGELVLKSWKANNPKDTFIKIRIIATADSYSRTTQRLFSAGIYNTDLDSIRKSLSYLRQVNKPFPAAITPMALATGKPFDSNALLSKISVIDCWYYGCPACMIEAEELQNIMPRFKSDSEVQFLSFFRDSAYTQRGKAYFYKQYFRKNAKTQTFTKMIEWSPEPYSAQHFYNLSQYESALSSPGYPVTYLTDKNGVVRCILEGASEGIGAIIERQIRLWQGFVSE